MTMTIRQFMVYTALVLGLLLPAISFAQTPKDPSLNEIYQAAQSGKLGDAETMINQVLINHPDSAKAHYVAAEVYAKAGKMKDARLQLEVAEKITPGLGFVKADSVDRLKAQLGVSNSGSSARAPSWVGWVVGFALIFLVIAVIKRLLAPKSQPVYQPAYQAPNAGNGAFNPSPYGSGYPPPQSGGMGSTLLGGLATGAAVGAGIVAGEALMHKILEDDQPHPDQAGGEHLTENNLNRDMGGENFGIDDSGSWDNGSSSFSDSSSDFSDNSSDWT